MATVRTLHAAEARAVTAAVEGATTTVAPDLAHHSTAAVIDQLAPNQPLPNALSQSATSSAPSATGHQPTLQAATGAPPSTVPDPVVNAVVGDLLAFNVDLLGAPAAVINNLSFAADEAIANLTGATAGTFPAFFGVAERVDHLTADLNNLNHALQDLGGFLPSGAGDNLSSTPSGVNTGTTAASNSGAASAAATHGPDPFAVVPLIGDVAILGIDMVASPFAFTQTLTRAVAAEATDIGAGDMQAAMQAGSTIVHQGFGAIQTRISDDEKNIGAVIARLMGTASPTTGQVGTADSGAGAASAAAATKSATTATTPATKPHLTKMGPGPVTRPTSPTPTTKSVGAKHSPGAVHVSTTAGSTTVAAPSVTQQGSSLAHAPRTTANPTQHGGNTTGTTKTATHSPAGAGGQSSAKAGGSTNGTSTAKHAKHAKPHKDGAKHAKHAKH